jgi:hypothetical protein
MAKEKKRITAFRFEDLRNAEIARAIPHIVAIIEKSSVAPRLDKRLRELISCLPDLEKIEVQERKWHEAKQLNEAERSRDGYVNTLIRIERIFSRVVIPEYEEASKLLTALFDKHKRDIATDTNIGETQRIYDLVDDIEKTPALLDALNTLGLTPVYKHMKVANSLFDELWQQRNKDLSEHEHVDTKAIRSNCVKIINALYEGIEYLADEEDNAPEWMSLIRALSQLGTYYKQQLKARNTRRKNKQKTEDEPPIQPPTDEDINQINN